MGKRSEKFGLLIELSTPRNIPLPLISYHPTPTTTMSELKQDLMSKGDIQYLRLRDPKVFVPGCSRIVQDRPLVFGVDVLPQLQSEFPQLAERSLIYRGLLYVSPLNHSHSYVRLKTHPMLPLPVPCLYRTPAAR